MEEHTALLLLSVVAVVVPCCAVFLVVLLLVVLAALMFRSCRPCSCPCCCHLHLGKTSKKAAYLVCLIPTQLENTHESNLKKS